jgi:flagellar biosynthesis/type III secretory pathway chaperone
MKTHMNAVEEKSGNRIQLQGQLDTAHREEMTQLSRQWEILLRTIRDLRTKAQAQQKVLAEKTQEITQTATELDTANQQIALLTRNGLTMQSWRLIFTLRYRPRGKLWQRFMTLSGGRF